MKLSAKLRLLANANPEGCNQFGCKSSSGGRQKKPSDKLRDMDVPTVLGYELDRQSLTPKRETIDTSRSGDYGADPLPNGMHRMIPSGDIVTYEERVRRLAKK
jgi:hypothetical protein